MCNKVCIVKDGIMIEQGSIEELQNKYMKYNTMYIHTNENEVVGHLLARMDTTRSVRELPDGRLEIKLKRELSRQELELAKHQMVRNILDAGYTLEEMSRKVLSMEDIFFRATAKEENLDE